MATDLHEKTLELDLEAALTALIKLVKALKLYPLEHPALQATAADTSTAFQPLLARHGSQPYHVTKEGFSYNATPLAPNNQAMKDLARTLLERRVRHLLFLPELTGTELLIFAEELSRPAAELQNDGGLPARLSQRQVRGLWLNETNLETILDSIRSMDDAPEPPAAEAQPAETTGPADGEEEPFAAPTSTGPDQHLVGRMRELLELLKDPLDDDSHASLMEQVRQLAPEFLDQTAIPGALALFSLLATQQRDSTRSPAQRQAAELIGDQLLDSTRQQLLADALADQTLKASQRRALGRLLVSLGMKIAPVLLQRLFDERDAILRRHYVSVLAHMGDPLLPLLESRMTASQWFVVRNIVTVLGETRQPAALPLLEQAAGHPEPRVRRALIQALSRIGGSEVIPLLVRLSKDMSSDLHQPAIMALGGLGSSDAVAPLADILKQPDLFGKQTPLKLEAIRALATLRSPLGIPPLLKLAKRGNLLRNKGLETLRAEAILALGQIGNPHLIPLLERLPKSKLGPVSRALRQATNQLRKQTHGG